MKLNFAQKVGMQVGCFAGIYMGVWATLESVDFIIEHDYLDVDEKAMNHVIAASSMFIVTMAAFVGANAGFSAASGLSLPRSLAGANIHQFWQSTSQALSVFVDGSNMPGAKDAVYNKAEKWA